MLAISLNISLGQSQINEEDLVTFFIKSNTEVIRFDVSMNEVSAMKIFYSGNQLIIKHCLEGELSE